MRVVRGGLSQADFGASLGVSQPTVRNYENNVRLPDSEFIKNVCNKFAVSAEWLLFGPEGQKSGDIANEKLQQSEIIESENIKTGDVATSPPSADSIKRLENELLTLYRENNQLVREIADLRAENSRLHNQLAAAVGALGKTTAGVTSPNAMDKAG